MSDRIKVVGYAQRQYYNNGIEYRNFTDNLVGQQQTSGDALPYSISNIFDTDFSSDNKITRSFVTNKFSNFITLNDINLDDVKVKEITGNDNQLYLNLDFTKTDTFAYFGSFKEYLRVSLENIINKWPAGILLDLKNNYGVQQTTVESYLYDNINNISTFKVNTTYFSNPYNIYYMGNSVSFSGVSDERNLPYLYQTGYTENGPYDVLVSGNSYNILGFTGSTTKLNSYVYVKTSGNCFSGLTGTSGSVKYHLKPNNIKVDKFFNELNDFEKHLLNRYSLPKYRSLFYIKLFHDNGNIVYMPKPFTWPTSDGYNLDFDSPSYISYVGGLIELADETDLQQSDLVSRFFVSDSIREFDTEDEKIDKTLKIYGRNFDEIKKYIDGISFANTISYNKQENLPDGLIKTLAQTLGWELTDSIINNTLLSSYLTNETSSYTGLTHGMSDYEKELEFWRRMILNTPWLWKSKGTRKGVEYLLKMIGTPKGLIEFNEYVYTINKKIDVGLIDDLINQSDNIDINVIPIDSEGYPMPLKNTADMYFQNDGLWYRETAGNNATLDKLTGNNPHIGPYDGGFKYMNQFSCVIPNFTATTIVKEIVSTGTTNLYINDDCKYSTCVNPFNIILDYKAKGGNINEFFHSGTQDIGWYTKDSENYCCPNEKCWDETTPLSCRDFFFGSIETSLKIIESEGLSNCSCCVITTVETYLKYYETAQNKCGDISIVAGVETYLKYIEACSNPDICTPTSYNGTADGLGWVATWTGEELDRLLDLGLVNACGEYGFEILNLLNQRFTAAQILVILEYGIYVTGDFDEFNPLHYILNNFSYEEILYFLGVGIAVTCVDNYFIIWPGDKFLAYAESGDVNSILEFIDGGSLKPISYNNQEIGSGIYISVYDNLNNLDNGCYNVSTEIIENPFPLPNITVCGCELTECDNASKICISKPNYIESSIDDCGIQSFRLAEDGYVVFTIDNQETRSISKTCCESINFSIDYPDENNEWCKWAY